jgi:hypothetical protein
VPAQETVFLAGASFPDNSPGYRESFPHACPVKGLVGHTTKYVTYIEINVTVILRHRRELLLRATLTPLFPVELETHPDKKSPVEANPRETRKRPAFTYHWKFQ